MADLDVLVGFVGVAGIVQSDPDVLFDEQMDLDATAYG
jgi:hypothetical protein